MSLIEITQQIDPELRSDKSNAYLIFYEELFDQKHLLPLNILEVGILHGGSLLMFARYFEQARLLGIDISQPPPKFYDIAQTDRLGERVAVACGSQSDRGFLDTAISGYFGDQQLDIVIDDASHFYRHTRVTFDHVFNHHLKAGGTYIIEDWGCGYWPKWPDGNPNGRSGLPRLVKELVDLVALEDRTRLFDGKRAKRADDVQKSPIQRMIIVPSIVALIKA
jgi:SAM-dependent methyltransferase